MELLAITLNLKRSYWGEEHMSRMTSRERMICAMKGGMPDRVPVAPDISNMIPCKLTGKPFWEIYYYNNPPLWKAYIDAVHTYNFVLSTGDQCGRDIPEENLFAMVTVAQEFGQYPLDVCRIQKEVIRLSESH
jgi:hypothetical protein